MVVMDAPPDAGGQRYLSISAIAEYLDVAPAVVQRLIEDRELEGIRIAGSWRVARESLEAFEADQREIERLGARWREAQDADVIDLFADRRPGR